MVRPSVLILLIALVPGAFSSSVDEWIAEIFIPQRAIAGIFESTPIGLRYNRGFPRGIWGTNLAPDLGAYDEGHNEFLVQGFFWNKVKLWLANEPNRFDAQAVYDAFRRHVFDYMCEGGTWGCCVAGIRDLTCRYPPKSMQDVIFVLLDPKENMPVLFLFWWCMHSWMEYYSLDLKRDANTAMQLRRNLRQFCPSPCLAKPCRRIPGVLMPNKCKAIGPFEDDYECTCRKEFVWDRGTKTCTAINPCFARAYAPCYAPGTLTCLALDMQGPKCICKPEYMGKDCAQLRNACLHRFNESEPNGNSNCGVARGNLCNPVLGTDLYKCTCTTGWMPSLSLPYDNCAILNDPCAAGEGEEEKANEDKPRVTSSVKCQNGGYCISSPDYSTAACLCPTTTWGDQTHMGDRVTSVMVLFDGLAHPNSSKGKHKLTSENKDILPCSETLPCKTLRLTGKFRHEIFDFRRLYVFLLIVGSEVS
ncbi:unnamed protein product [Mesocestoides corti]|uniref:EGF-like domain-containing protein n=1 Tax=Mesocestoides corti TaxID=53468 RepID=A0A0R3UE15_MESCO|nr:unnamed protein product [Mesocestoides corti]